MSKIIKRPKLLTVAYMQARVPSSRASPIIHRQRKKLELYQNEYMIPIHLWYARAKGLSPVPTIEELIIDGQVYAVIVTSWEKLRGCNGHWGDLWKLLNEHPVRKTCFQEKWDRPVRGEPSLFRVDWGGVVPGPWRIPGDE